MQIFFGKDGSLFLSFPYLHNKIGILSAATIPANGEKTAQVDLQEGGKVTSHLVKYSHHPDGRAHFSQDGKIYTAIKRQSIALDVQEGHLFSLLIQGLTALEPVNPIRDVNNGGKKTVIEFQVQPTPAMKIIGRWYDVNRLRASTPTATIGPIIPINTDGNRMQQAIIVASPHANARHVLLLTCDEHPTLGTDPEAFMFYGGFDPRDAIVDPNKEAGFLAFHYPIVNADELKQKIGSVDFIRNK